LHSNVDPDSPVKAKLALVDALGLGGVDVSVGFAGAEAASAIATPARAASTTALVSATLVAVLFGLMFRP
jgi:hypothetical protein